MGTVATVGDLALVKVRDSSQNIKEFSDPNLLSIINAELENIYQDLVFVESNLVYAEGSVTTVDGTAEYTPSFSHNGFLPDGVWVDGEDTFLFPVPESYKVKYDYDTTEAQPEAYYLTEDGKVGFLWVPDDAYTVYIQYWEPLTALTDYDTDTLPWDGIFNRYIGRKLVVELLEMVERDASRHALLASMEYDKAMNMVYIRGIRQRRQVSDMFKTVPGI